MKKYLFLLVCVAQLWSLDYIYSPDPVLFAGTIQGRQILVTPRQIYTLAGQYYQSVYQLPEPIKIVTQQQNILRTDKYILDFTNGIQLIPELNNNLQSRPVSGRFLAVDEIKNIYVYEDLDNDGVREIIFRYDGNYYLASTNDTVIKQAVPWTMLFSVTMLEFSFTYKNRDYVYVKNGQRWNKDTAEKYSAEALQKLSVEELELLRAVIEARKGRIFTNKQIKNYLQKQNWYKPDPNYTKDYLTPKELQNIELIFSVENVKLRESMYEKKIALP